MFGLSKVEGERRREAMRQDRAEAEAQRQAFEASPKGQNNALTRRYRDARIQAALMKIRHDGYTDLEQQIEACAMIVSRTGADENYKVLNHAIRRWLEMFDYDCAALAATARRAYEDDRRGHDGGNQ